MIRPTKSALRFALSLLISGFAGVAGSASYAQDACCFEPSYRLQCDTVLQPQTVQRMRVTYQTDFVEEQVTRSRPVLKKRTEEREYRVAIPITETSFREERFTVWKPVVETSFRDETYQQTSYVTETAEREEQFTTYKPVVETQVYQQRYAVQRPVTETQFVDQQYMVQRPVVETQMTTQQVTSLRPVTSVRNQTVDTGGYVAQRVVTPGQVGVGLNYYPNAYATPGPLGLFARVRGGYAYGPQVTPTTVQTQVTYRPNLVTQQVSQTSLVPQTQQVQVPVQVQRMQTEVVSQRVPVSVQRMETQTVVQNVPVQTTRMVATTETRKVPYTVTKPVTQTLTRKVPVQNRRWLSEEKVRKVPVQTTRVVYETRKRPVEVSYYEQEQFTQTVRRPVTREVLVPVTETIMVPQQVVQRVPLSYYDPFSPAIVNGFSSFDSSSFGSSIVSPSSNDGVVSQKPAIEQPKKADEKTLNAPESLSDIPQTKLRKFEVEKPKSASERGMGINGGDLFDGLGGDAQELPAPSLNNSGSDGPSLNGAQGDSGVNATEAGWKVRWMPRLAREV